MKRNSIKSFKCAQCGAIKDATIYPNMADYVYKRVSYDTHYFCGYNCMLAWERENEDKKRRNIRRRNSEQRAKMIIKKNSQSAKLRAEALEMYLGGETLEEISIVLNKTVHTVQRYLRESGYKWNWATRSYVKVVADG